MLTEQVWQNNKMEKGFVDVRIPIIRIARFLELKIFLDDLLGDKGYLVRGGLLMFLSQYISPLLSI